MWCCSDAVVSERLAHPAPERIERGWITIPLVDAGDKSITLADRIRQAAPGTKMQILVVFQALPDQFQADAFDRYFTGPADTGRPARVEQRAVAIASEHIDVIPGVYVARERLVHAEVEFSFDPVPPGQPLKDAVRHWRAIDHVTGPPPKKPPPDR